MAESDDDRPGDRGLHEKLLDTFVYVPAGLALSVADELPRLAARGRDRFGVRVSSARAVGRFAVKAGHAELVRRSDGWFNRSDRVRSSAGDPSPAATTGERPPSAGGAHTGAAPSVVTSRAATPSARTGPGRGPVNGHIPSVGALSIPGFDTLSASQVVQRLDGLNRLGAGVGAGL